MMYKLILAAPLLLLLSVKSTFGEENRAPAGSPTFERTEHRQDCEHYTPQRRALFGDLHVHTSYSFDSYLSSQRRDPWEAYGYAQGEAITLPDANGLQGVKARIGRPLDFTAVTDHAEFLGQINI